MAQGFNEEKKPHRYCLGDLVRYRVRLSGFKGQKLSAKQLLKFSIPVTIGKVLRSNVVLLANPDDGVIIRSAHVIQLKSC